jgi:hypothetical protein
MPLAAERHGNPDGTPFPPGCILFTGFFLTSLQRTHGKSGEPRTVLEYARVDFQLRRSRPWQLFMYPVEDCWARLATLRKHGLRQPRPHERKTLRIWPDRQICKVRYQVSKVPTYLSRYVSICILSAYPSTPTRSTGHPRRCLQALYPKNREDW